MAPTSGPCAQAGLAEVVSATQLDGAHESNVSPKLGFRASLRAQNPASRALWPAGASEPCQLNCRTKPHCWTIQAAATPRCALGLPGTALGRDGKGARSPGTGQAANPGRTNTVCRRRWSTSRGTSISSTIGFPPSRARRRFGPPASTSPTYLHPVPPGRRQRPMSRAANVVSILRWYRSPPPWEKAARLRAQGCRPTLPRRRGWVLKPTLLPRGPASFVDYGRVTR